MTLPEHPYYSPHRSNINSPISRRNPKTQGSPPETQREDSTPSPIPTALAQARGSSNRRHLLIPSGPVSPSLVVRRWKDALDRATADRPSPAERSSRRPVCSELALYQARGGAGRLSPPGTGSRGLARRRAYAISSKGKGGPALPRRDRIPGVGPSASLRHIKRGVCWTAQTRGCAPDKVIATPGGHSWIPGPHCALGRPGEGQGSDVCPNSPSIVSSRRVRPAAIRPRRTSKAPDSRNTA